jgi:hypothetical protein
VTSPFASIINAPHSAADNLPEPQSESAERNSFAEAVAEDIRADELAAISVSPEEPPFGMNELAASTKTGSLPCATKKVAGLTTLPVQQRKPLHGSEYSEDEVLELLNLHYMVGKSEQEVAIFRINDDGSLAFVPSEQFKLDVANIIVKRSVDGKTKRIPAEKFWKESPRRHQRKIVFKPGGETQPEEFNLWYRFGVEPSKGWGMAEAAASDEAHLGDHLPT